LQALGNLWPGGALLINEDHSYSKIKILKIEINNMTLLFNFAGLGEALACGGPYWSMKASY